ncbi:MAG TPA: hypothetical protein VIR81_02560 [Myxococcales bacterium]
MNRIAIVIAVAAAACGGHSVATDQNRAGSGTSTLLVTADVTAQVTSSGPLTSFQVTVKDGSSQPVSGATVTIHNDQLGDVPLVEANAISNPGRYSNSKAAVGTSAFTLSVVRNADNVQGVVVGNPGAHTVNAPVANSTVPANQPLVLSWTTPTTAKSVSISTRGFQVQAPDTGTYTISAADNPAQTNQHLDLSRFNEVDIAGGLSGSRLRVTYTASVNPYTVQ